MIIISGIRLRRKDKKVIPVEIKPLVIRNALEMVAIVCIFVSVRLIPISTFMILFNTKAVLIYLLKIVLDRKLPPLSFILSCICCFVGMIMVIWPRQEGQSASVHAPSSADGLSSNLETSWKVSEMFGILGCLFGTIGIGLSDIYLNNVGSFY